MPSGKLEMEIEPLREAFERSRRSASEVARQLDWRHCGSPDVVRVRRQLGLHPYHPGHGYPPRLRSRCSYQRYVELARAIGVDPAQVGA